MAITISSTPSAIRPTEQFQFSITGGQLGLVAANFDVRFDDAVGVQATVDSVVDNGSGSYDINATFAVTAAKKINPEGYPVFIDANGDTATSSAVPYLPETGFSYIDIVSVDAGSEINTQYAGGPIQNGGQIVYNPTLTPSNETWSIFDDTSFRVDNSVSGSQTASLRYISTSGVVDVTDTINFEGASVFSSYMLNVTSRTYVNGGSTRGDRAVICMGDSNMVGLGGGIDPTLDEPAQDVYYFKTDNTVNWVNVPAGVPYVDHEEDTVNDEVGPDVPFINKYAQERPAGRVVELPSGKSGSGFSTADWDPGEPMRLHTQDLVNQFLALGPYNRVVGAISSLGANDVGDFVPDTIWRDKYEALINDFQSTEFNTTLAQEGWTDLPFVALGMPPDFYTGVPDRQALQDHIEAIPGRELYTGYGDSTGLPSLAGDDIHLSGESQRTMGSDRAWTGFLNAELNT